MIITTDKLRRVICKYAATLRFVVTLNGIFFLARHSVLLFSSCSRIMIRQDCDFQQKRILLHVIKMRWHENELQILFKIYSASVSLNISIRKMLNN